MSKLPSINRKHKICVICEGAEDHAYREYGQIKAKIDAFHGGSTSASQHMIIYAKPRAAAQSSGYRLRQYEFYCVLGTL